MLNKKAVSALVATVLLILITVAAVGIIWGAVMPMLNQATQIGQACMQARLTIDTTSGYTCYDESNKQVNVMVARGAEDFQLAGIQIGLASQGETNAYTVRKDINLIKNGSFESWSAGPNAAPDGWITTGTPTITRETDTSPIIASYQSKITAGSNEAGLYIVNGDPYWVTVKPLTTYTFSVYAKVTSGDTALAAVLFYNGITYNNIAIAESSTSTSWTLVTRSFTTTANTDNLAIKLLALSNTDVVWYSGAMLVEGTDIVSWEENTIYGELPSQNEAKTYKMGVSDEITEATVAPVVRIGNREKTCDVTSKVQMPRCA